MRRFCLFVFAFFFCVAASNAADRCGDFLDIMTDLSNVNGKTFDSFTFKEKQEGKNVLVIFKSDDGKDVRSWALINRIADVSHFCVIAQGDKSGFGLLKSAATNSFEEKFGMPGSGFPRCASGDDPLGTIKVRMWANRELGDSTIMYTESKSGPDFVYLMSRENNWIIVQTKKIDEKSTCYFAVGEEVIFRPNGRWNR